MYPGTVGRVRGKDDPDKRNSPSTHLQSSVHNLDNPTRIMSTSRSSGSIKPVEELKRPLRRDTEPPLKRARIEPDLVSSQSPKHLNAFLSPMGSKVVDRATSMTTSYKEFQRSRRRATAATAKLRALESTQHSDTVQFRSLLEELNVCQRQAKADLQAAVAATADRGQNPTEARDKPVPSLPQKVAQRTSSAVAHALLSPISGPGFMASTKTEEAFKNGGGAPSTFISVVPLRGGSV